MPLLALRDAPLNLTNRHCGLGFFVESRCSKLNAISRRGVTTAISPAAPKFS
jgi:hypothetical protein